MSTYLPCPYNQYATIGPTRLLHLRSGWTTPAHLPDLGAETTEPLFFLPFFCHSLEGRVSVSEVASPSSRAAMTTSHTVTNWKEEKHIRAVSAVIPINYALIVFVLDKSCGHNGDFLFAQKAWNRGQCVVISPKTSWYGAILHISTQYLTTSCALQMYTHASGTFCNWDHCCKNNSFTIPLCFDTSISVKNYDILPCPRSVKNGSVL